MASFRKNCLDSASGRCWVEKFFSIFNFFPNLGVMTSDLFNIANVFEKCYYTSGRLFRSKKVKTHALGKVCFFLYKIFFQLGDLI